VRVARAPGHAVIHRAREHLDVGARQLGRPDEREIPGPAHIQPDRDRDVHRGARAVALQRTPSVPTAPLNPAGGPTGSARTRTGTGRLRTTSSRRGTRPPSHASGSLDPVGSAIIATASPTVATPEASG
jgi:hypothetical protein